MVPDGTRQGGFLVAYLPEKIRLTFRVFNRAQRWRSQRPEMHQGFFITIEGGEGVGKSTFVKLFHSEIVSLAARAGATFEIVQTREPGGTPVANSIRAIFANPPQSEPLTPEAEAMLVMAGRAQHVANLIRPALARGAIVLCDRFADSMMVYQGVIGGIDRAWLETTNRAATKGLEPDITFLLDCPVEVSSRRSEHRTRSGQADDSIQRYDEVTTSQHEKIRAGFLECARRAPGRFVVLDATQAPQDVVASAIATLSKRAPAGLFGGSSIDGHSRGTRGGGA